MVERAYKRTEETRKNISNSKIGEKNGMFGKHCSEETKKKMSLARQGKKFSPMSEQGKINLSLAHKGYIMPKEQKRNISLSNRGHTVSEQTRKKISMAHKGKVGKHHTDEAKQKIGKSTAFRHQNNPFGVFIKGHQINLGKRYPKDKYPNYGLRKIRKTQILPTKDTSIEVKLQNYLKQLNIEFFTHQYMHIEHGYQCDILIPSLNLVIECDGNYWHHYPTGNEVDHIRTKELLEKGFKVLRLWEFEINAMTIEGFKERIYGKGK